MDYGSIRGTVRLSVAGPTQTLTDVLERAHMVGSKDEASRLLAQSMVWVNGYRLRPDDRAFRLDVPGEYRLVVGSAHDATVILEEP